MLEAIIAKYGGDDGVLRSSLCIPAVGISLDVFLDISSFFLVGCGRHIDMLQHMG